MEPIQKHTGIVYPMNRTNVDTDQIIPKQFLKRISRQGFGQFVFYNWRYDSKGELREDFPMNQPKYEGTSILVAGENFGCGSSREHAPWALLDYGFRVIIAQSYADIFYNNCTKNGILPVQLPEEQIQELMERAEAENYQLTVDLENKKLFDNQGFEASFDLDEYKRQMLLNGWDDISITLGYEDDIKAFEQKQA